MKKTIAAACFLLAVFAGGESQSMSFLPCSGVSGDVPTQSSFVMTTERATSLLSALEGGKDPGFAYTLAPIDNEYVRLVVSAVPDASFRFPRATRCEAGILRADAKWRAPQKSFAPVLRKSDSSAIIVSWDKDVALGETRVDWAFSAAELQAGHYSTDLSEELLHSRGSSLRVSSGRELAGEVYFLRITRYAVDGSEKVWKGWALQDEKGRFQSGEGKLPRQLERRFAATHPCSEAPRLVAPDPMFFGRRAGPVETKDGTPLVTIANEQGVEVRAGLGTIFRFVSVPRSSCPDLFQVVSPELLPGLKVVDAELESFGGDPQDYSLQLALEADEVWPQIQVRWSARQETLQEAPAAKMPASRIEFTNMHWIDPIKIPVGVMSFYVELTPIWPDTRPAPSLIGKVTIEITSRTRRATFDAIGDAGR